MEQSNEPYTVAAAQLSPVFLNRDATVAKACDAIREAAGHGARLVLLPEAFIPCYPDWTHIIPPGEWGRLDGLYVELLANAVTIPGPVTEELCRAARENGIYVAVGVNERNDEASGTTLYNTLLYIDDRGRIMGKHRKLMPTAGERLVWGEGDGSPLEAYDTAVGQLRGLVF